VEREDRVAGAVGQLTERDKCRLQGGSVGSGRQTLWDNRRHCQMGWPPLGCRRGRQGVYEIYQAENRPRTATSVVSGWTGAWAGVRGGAWAGARICAGIALVAGQAGPQAAAPEEVITIPTRGAVGGLIGGTGGGIGGYIFGRSFGHCL
jgi:hypothetical protein